MSLPNYLAKIKSSGIYRFVWDKSEIAGVDAEVLRLVVGYSDKGPFNTPIYIKSDTEFKTVFGDISKKMEKRGIFFHRMALQALAKGPIIALNLKKFAGETLKATSFNVGDEIKLKDVFVEDIYDTTRFWKLDPEAILSATSTGSDVDKSYISISAADSKDTSCSVFIRGYKPTGYDVTITNWYSSQGEEIPDYFVDGDKDYSSLLVSDFFAEIYVFRGEFTPALCATEPLNKYFYINSEGKPVLKEYIENAFGEKVDTLAALAADDASNFVNSYSGCLLPYFKNQVGTYVSLDLAFNSDNALHKMMMHFNSDLLYSGDVKINELVTTGWTSNAAFSAPLKHTTEIFSATEMEEVKDGDVLLTKKYNYDYSFDADKEATAFDPDFIKYEGTVSTLSPEQNKIVKYFGGCEYEYDGPATRTIGNVEFKVKLFVATGKTYMGSNELLILNDDVYRNDGIEFVKDTSGYKFEDLSTLPVYDTEHATYAFKSYNSEALTNELAYGKAKVVSQDKTTGKTTIEVIENSVEGFVGNEYVVHSLVAGKAMQLYTVEGSVESETGIWVVVELTPSTYYRYAGTEIDNNKEYTVYRAANNTASELIDELIYVYAKEIYKKEATLDSIVYAKVSGFTIGEIIAGTKNGFNFLSVGLEVGNRILVDNEVRTITKLDEDFMTVVDFEGNEREFDRTETIVLCNHSASVTDYELKPFYFEGYTYTHEKPESTNDWYKLQWHHFILSALTEYQGLRVGLTSKADIDFRYVVDTFEGLVDTELHKELSLICKEKDNAVAFLNFPAMKTFKNCQYVSFKDDQGRLQVKFIDDGGNKRKPASLLFSLVSEVNGASFSSYNTPLVFSDGTVKTIVPAAALVSNNFIEKYESRQPYYIVAGPTYGRMIYAGLVGPEFNFTRADLDILEPMGVNCMVYVPRLGTYINSNQTAKQTPVTALSKINVRELVIYIQDEIEKLMQDYQWEFNTPYLRDLIKNKADYICENVKNNHGLYEYLNVCDESNNTDDVINNEMLVLSTSIEPGMGAGKMVQELTIYKKGGMSAIIR